jgi:hypothetical protein
MPGRVAGLCGWTVCLDCVAAAQLTMASCRKTPASSAAACMEAASAAFSAIGFSQRTCLPAACGYNIIKRCAASVLAFGTPWVGEWLRSLLQQGGRTGTLVWTGLDWTGFGYGSTRSGRTMASRECSQWSLVFVPM